MRIKPLKTTFFLDFIKKNLLENFAGTVLSLKFTERDILQIRCVSTGTVKKDDQQWLQISLFHHLLCFAPYLWNTDETLSCIFLLLQETQNALQLPVFFFFLLFFCQPYSGLWNCKLVFLSLKIFQYGGSRRWVQIFTRYPSKKRYKNRYLYF